MFIADPRTGYKGTEQYASGRFLILVQPHYSSKKYPTQSPFCETCGGDDAAHDAARAVRIPTCELHGVMARLKARAMAGQSLNNIPDAEFEENPQQDCQFCRDRATAIEAAGCRDFKTHRFDYPIRAIVRRVAMRQCGNFMMGQARAYGHTLTLSGAYGGDGLPTSVPDAVYDRAIALPAELVTLWSNGGGWNSAGSEAGSMRVWAHANIRALRGAK